MLVLVIWLVALGIGLVVVGALAYELLGHARRTRLALTEATDDLLPKVQALSPPRPAGRHRATGGSG